MSIQTSKTHLLRQRRLATALLATLAASTLQLACGSSSGSSMSGGGGDAGTDTSDGGEASSTGVKPNASNGAGETGEGGSPVVNCDELPTESITLDQPIWQTGFKVTLGTATLKPQTPSCAPGIVTIDAQFENRATQTQTFDARTLLSSDGKDYELPYGQDLPNVPGGRLGKGSFTFEVDDTFSFDDASLSFGGADRHQAMVPFGENSPERLITLEPQSVPLQGKVVAGNVTVAIEGCAVLADEPWEYASVAVDEALLRIYFSATYTGTTLPGVNLFDDNFSLLLPDGTSIPADCYVNEVLDDPGVAIKGLELRFRVPSPTAGKYVLESGGRWGGKNNFDAVHADFPFTLPSVPTFGDE